MSLRPSAVVLIIVNLLPLIGVAAFGWDVVGVLLLYWAESLVIGVINVLRMATCRVNGGFGRRARQPRLNSTGNLRYENLPGVPSNAAKLFMIPFFIVHYGMFNVGHLAAIVGLFTAEGLDLKLHEALKDLWREEFWLPLTAIAASHLYSFLVNFIGSGEHRRTRVSTLMSRPYGRILSMQVAIVLGAGLVQALGSPLPMLLLLILAKTAIDLREHQRERRLFGEEEGMLA